jgi:ribosomal protein L11 methyltransferase
VVDWVEIVVPAPAATVDDVAALVVDEIAAASAGIEIRGSEVIYWVPLAERDAALAAAKIAVGSWQERGAEIDPGDVRWQSAVPEAEWRDAWKRYFHSTRITRRLVIVPSWETYQEIDGDLVLHLDPGMAFGTGTHASTSLVLEEMQELADERFDPGAILDVGTGSGILAIAGCRLWPGARCEAVDNDPIAVAACTANARSNGVAAQISASERTLEALPGSAQLVLANIQAHVLRALRDPLIARCSSGGVMILSGLLTPQAPAVASEFVAAGMTLSKIRPSRHDDQWSVVVLRAQ